MTTSISYIFSVVNIFSQFWEIMRPFLFRYTNYYSEKDEVDLLNITSLEMEALEDYYTKYGNGVPKAPAKFIASLANHIGSQRVTLSAKKIITITKCSKSRVYDNISIGKIAGLIERKPTGKKNNYSIKLHVPKFILPCSNGIDRYIFEVVQNAYTYDLVFSPECIINIAARARFIGEDFLFESLQQSVDNLIDSQKLYCNNNILKPKVLDDAVQKDNCITISSLNKQYSNLNKNQTYFLDWINRTCGFYLHESLHQGQGVINRFVLYHPKSENNPKTEAAL